MSERGVFIALEGVDGSGKSTQGKLLAQWLEGLGHEVVMVREPGGTSISEKIRSLVLDPAHHMMSDQCELLLYEASRAQLVQEVIAPSLERGAVVLCDRFFDSTYAYQFGGRGLDEEIVLSANALGSCGVSPHKALVLDMDPEAAFERATQGGADRLEAEGLAFQKRVCAAYQRLAQKEPDRVVLVDAEGLVEEVSKRLQAALADVLPQ